MPSDHSFIRLLIARRGVGYTCHLEVDDSATAEDSIYGPENAGPATHMLSCSPRDAVGEVVGALEEFCHSVVKSSEFSSLRLGDVKLFTRMRRWRRNLGLPVVSIGLVILPFGAAARLVCSSGLEGLHTLDVPKLESRTSTSSFSVHVSGHDRGLNPRQTYVWSCSSVVVLSGALESLESRSC